MKTLVEGTNARIVVYLVDRHRNPIDLTGARADLVWRIGASGSQTSPMYISDRPGGVCQYRFATDELTPGLLSAEVAVLDANSEQNRTEGVLQILVRRNLS